MAKEAKNQKKTDDWFGESDVVSSDIRRYAMGDPNEKGADPEVTLMQVTGYYEESFVQAIKDDKRLLHQIKLREPLNGQERILLWGNHAIDDKLPTLEFGEKIRITYMGRRDIGGNKTLKELRLEFAAGAKRRSHPFPEAAPKSGLQSAALKDGPPDASPDDVGF